jgi:membrane associated rhomboid family serine protease
MSGFSMFPSGIKFLLLGNIAVFLCELLFGPFHFAGGSLDEAITKYFALWPLDSGYFMPWQVFSYTFLHDGFGHIFMNMFVLWMFGVEVENTWGTKKFLIYYFLCGLGGAAAHLILSGFIGAEQGSYLIGASGAVFGILVAFGLMFPDRKIYFFFLLPIPAKLFVTGYIALEIYSIWGSSDNVSHLAHLGGAVVGILYMLITTGGKVFALRKKDSSSPPFWRGTGNRPAANGTPGNGFFRSNPKAVDAEYQDLDGGTSIAAGGSTTVVNQPKVITQDEIDRILDKIAATGYQNLTDAERDILFEASRRMEAKK